MRKKFFICSALVSVALLSAPHAYSEDDVIVDLSVLGSLQNVSAPVQIPQVKTQPLFPTVQQKASQPKSKRHKKRLKRRLSLIKRKKLKRRNNRFPLNQKKKK